MFEFKVHSPDIASLEMIHRMITRDALIIAMNDTFLAISILFIGGLILVPLFDQPKNTGEVMGQ